MFPSDAVAEVERWVGRLAPSECTPSEAVEQLDALVRLQKLVAAGIALLAPRAAEASAWRRDGARDPASWLAQKSGTSRARAADVLAIGERVASLPVVERALRSGRLSAEQAALVSDGAAAAPEAAGKLVSLAGRDSLHNLRTEVVRVKAAAEPDAEARYRRIHATRYLRFGRDADGAGTGCWRVTPEVQAEIESRLAPFVDERFERARAEGHRETAEAYAADALLEMARAKGPARKAPAKVIVRIDHEALVRGEVAGDEVCEVNGMALPVSVVDGMVASGDAFLTAVVTKGRDVLTVAHLGRRPNSHQLTALQWRDTCCMRLGCSAPVAQWDHHDPWTAVLETKVSNLRGYCVFHHRQKTRGAEVLLTDVGGKVELRSPP